MLSYLPADASDVEALLALNRSLIERYEDLSVIDLPSVLAWERRKLEKRLGEYRAVFLGGAKVAYFRLWPGDGNTLELDDLYVLPGFQGRGVGTEIVRHCIAEADLQKKPLMLYVFTANTPAVRLYEKLNFRLREVVSPTRSILIRPFSTE